MICPECHQPLTISPEQWRCTQGHSFFFTDGIIDFLHNDGLSNSERKTIREYEELAESYDSLMNWYFKVFHTNETEVRNSMVKGLHLHPESTVLEIGCGTGSDSIFIYEQIAEKGNLSLLEISQEMLLIARNKIQKQFGDHENVLYALANVNKLPFEDDSFDAAFHFGGLNVFPDKAKAMQEMNRVVKEGGRIVIGDEGMPAWLRATEYGQMVMDYNSQYKHELDLSIIDKYARDVSVRWLIGNAYYLIEYTVSKKPLPLDTESPNPFFNKSMGEWVKEKRSKT
jgi:ubiquinone/menaquinone biosynthesis C-methylase UbiE